MKILENDWHGMPTEQVLKMLGVQLEQGLTSTEVQIRQAEYGANRLSKSHGISVWRLWFSQFNQVLIYILLICGITTAVLQEWVDASVIFGVVLINAMIGFIQEAHALKSIDALSRELIANATVLRDGVKIIIPASELVPGDLVYLQSGDLVTADLRLINVRELRVDESALTGESVPVSKQQELLPLATVMADRLNMAYSSALVNYGTALGVVVAIGDATEIGRINRLMTSAESLETPLTRKMTEFSRLLLWVIIGFALLTFLVGVWRGASYLDMFMAAVAMAVGAIPEGLPAAITITLAIGVARMAKRNAIIRKLPAVETLGSTTVICSDKTGTLTRNQMTVQEIFAGGETFQVSGTGYIPAGEFVIQGQVVDLPKKPALLACLQAGLLCNDARLVNDANLWKIEGDPTEAALLVSAHKAGLTQNDAATKHKRLDAIPFESQHQFMATLNQQLDKTNRTVYLKGSVESLIERCDSVYDQAMQAIPLYKDTVLQQAADMAAKGMRVLAFACKNYSVDTFDHQHVASGLVFMGLQAMIDPPRPEAVVAITACHQAGIQVKMITGDHPITALAIARQLGMQNTGFAVSSAELQNLDDIQLQETLKACDVYARISPEQKLQLVKAMQASGQIVAMTGDGVNDAPALRQADIGIAMGLGGTEVAKEAAAMVLTDDCFASIEAAVEEGRGVFDNLVKFIAWTLPTNLGEGLVITAAIFANAALPITPLQILWINMTTAVLLGLTLAFEPKEPGLMDRQPRNPKQPVLTWHLGFRICMVSLLLLAGAFGLFEFEIHQGESLAVARTVAVNVFVFGQIFYLFNCRSVRFSMFEIGVFSNPWVIVGVVIMALLQLLFTYWPPMQMLFGSAAIAYHEWLWIMGIGFSIYMVVGFEKLLLRWRNATVKSGKSEL